MRPRHKVCAWLGLVSLACLSSTHAFAVGAKFVLPLTQHWQPVAAGDIGGFSEGSGTDEFVWDVVLHGPIIGFAMFF